MSSVSHHVACATSQVCDPATYSIDNASISCQACPTMHTSARGATSRSDCVCMPGFFQVQSMQRPEVLSSTAGLLPATTDCQRCPIGVSCRLPNSTVTAMQADPGFWRLSSDSDVFYPCLKGRTSGSKLVSDVRNVSTCYGGDAGDASCIANHIGPLCKV